LLQQVSSIRCLNCINILYWETLFWSFRQSKSPGKRLTSRFAKVYPTRKGPRRRFAKIKLKGKKLFFPGKIDSSNINEKVWAINIDNARKNSVIVIIKINFEDIAAHLIQCLRNG